jgi:Protein of unknown function (DUF3187)
VVRGPLPVRNQHPFALTLLHLRPRRPVATPEGKFAAGADLAHTSIYEVDSAPKERVAMDGELTRASARVRYGVGPRTDVEVEVAAIYGSSGFLDHLIDSFHKLTGLPNGGRDEADSDQFIMRLRRNGELLFDVEEDRVSFADVPVVVTHVVREEDERGPGVALRVGVELPTGSPERGAGNGGVDWAFGALAERSLGRWTLGWGVDVLLPEDPKSFRRAGVGLSDILALQFGTEMRWNDHTSLVGQAIWTSPMTRDFTLEEFNREILELALGVAWDGPGGSRFYAAFEEDAIAATGPDFGLALGVSWGF